MFCRPKFNSQNRNASDSNNYLGTDYWSVVFNLKTSALQMIAIKHTKTTYYNSAVVYANVPLLKTRPCLSQAYTPIRN